MQRIYLYLTLMVCGTVLTVPAVTIVAELGQVQQELTRPAPEANELAWSRWIAKEIFKLPDESIEFRVPDGARVDIYNEVTGIAWEVEWAGKHHEAIGQAIHYSMATGARGGIILLVGRGDRQKEIKSYLICMAAAARCDLALIVVDVRRKR